MEELRNEGKKAALDVTPRHPHANRAATEALVQPLPHPAITAPTTASLPLLTLPANADSSEPATAPSPQQPQASPGVRFKSTIEEFAPDHEPSTRPPMADGIRLGSPGQVTPDDIRELSNKLRACPLQERRMNIFSYEPVSLPVSRVRNYLSIFPLFIRLVGIGPSVEW